MKTLLMLTIFAACLLAVDHINTTEALEKCEQLQQTDCWRL